MKKLLLGGSLLLLHGLLHAQAPAMPQPHGGPGPASHRAPPPPPPAEMRWVRDSSTLQFHLQLPENKLRQMKTSFEDFYKALDNLLREERPRPPRTADVQRLVKTRDALVLHLLAKEEGEDFLRIEHLLAPPPPAPGY